MLKMNFLTLNITGMHLLTLSSRLSIDSPCLDVVIDGLLSGSDLKEQVRIGIRFYK